MEVKDAPGGHKRVGVACPWRSPLGGCRDYDHRPESCRAFRCAWLDGALESRDRPDLSGIVFTHMTTPDGAVLMAHVGPAGARPAGKVLLESLRRDRPVFVRRGLQIELRGPQTVVDRLFAAIQRQPPPGIEELTLATGRVYWRLAE